MNLVSRCQHLFASLWKRTSFKAAFLLILGIFVFVQATPVLAQQGGVGQAVDGSDISQIVRGASSISCGQGAPTCLLQVVSFIVTFIFSIISYFLSKLLVLLTSILITFARYNSFNNAPPVEIGWVIVRDICNMFFIIVLLVSAFATIIGKGEDLGMHYSNVIKKLLVAAVLVNFSRTIVLLLIDVSQVFTLTFVSAFEGTIAGNLIQGLGINQMVQLQEQNMAAGAQGGQQVIDVVGIGMAYLLSIFLLVTAVAIVLLYVGYFIVRIIALWMLIIASPFAFLADALPGTMKSVLPKEASGFWGQLSAQLTGGPLIAFWLWLSFATIQQTAASGGFASANIGFDFPQDGTANQVLGFVTRIGTAPQLAGFIVAVAMLGMGFKAATSTASSVAGGLLAGVAKRVEGYRDKAFSALARSPYTAVKTVGRGVGRGIGAAGRAGFNFADKKYGITSRLGSGIARGSAGVGAGEGGLAAAGGRLGDAMRLIPGVGGALATGAAGTLAARRAGLIGADKKKVDERMGDINKLPPEQRVNALRQLSGEDLSSGGVAALERQHEELSKAENKKVLQEVFEKQAAEKIKADAAAAGVTMTDKQVERQAKAVATKRVADEEEKRIAKLKEYAEKANDTNRLDALKKESEKKMRFDNATERDARLDEILKDPSSLKELDQQQLKTGKFVIDLMQRAGALKSDGTVDAMRLSDMKETFKDQKELLSSIDVMSKQIDGKGKSIAELQGMVIQDGPHDEKRLYSTSGNGEPVYSDKEKAAIAAMTTAGARTHGQPLSSTQQKAFQEARKAGLPLQMIIDAFDAKDSTGKSDGQLAAYYASLAHKAADDSKDYNNAVKEISGLIRMGIQGNSGPAERMDIAHAAVRSQEVVDNIFGNYNKMSKDRQKQVMSIVTELVAVENEIKKIDEGARTQQQKDIMTQLAYMREKIFPAEKVASTGPGVKDIPAAPASIRAALHP